MMDFGRPPKTLVFICDNKSSGKITFEPRHAISNNVRAVKAKTSLCICAV